MATNDVVSVIEGLERLDAIISGVAEQSWVSFCHVGAFNIFELRVERKYARELISRTRNAQHFNAGSQKKETMPTGGAAWSRGPQLQLKNTLEGDLPYLQIHWIR